VKPIVTDLEGARSGDLCTRENPDAMDGLSHAHGMRKPRGIRSMTGIRGVAAVWVLLFHAAQGAGTIFALPLLERVPDIWYGCLGVDLFFMLSGFILMYAHGRDFYELRKDSLIRFARLRITRVYPLNAVVLLLIATLVAFQPGYVAWARSSEGTFAYGGRAAFTFGAFVRTLFLANRWFLPWTGEWNQPVWSLSLEVLGYLLFPVMAFCVLRINRHWVLIALASLSLVGAYAILVHFAFQCEISQIAVFRMLACFVSGAAVFRLFKLTPLFGTRFAALITSLAAIGIVARDVPPFRYIESNGNIQFEFLFAALIYGLAFEQGFVCKLLSSRLIVFLGEISFPLYLVHVTPLLWLRYFMQTNSQRFSAAEKSVSLLCWAIGCIVVATLLHYFVEKPFHAWGRRWAGERVTP
jgi:peptidoglycan/LPS O-acetylase OafA/YrhL